MQAQYEYRQHQFNIEYSPRDSVCEICLGDRPINAAIVYKTANFIRCQINGVNHQIHFAIQGDQRFLHVDGRNFVVRKLSDRQKAKRSGVGSVRDLTAPMPGKVLKLMVTNDDIVEEGQPLLILEAMKMEYTIKAHRRGKVVGLKLNEGNQVDMGQLLLDIAEVAE